MERLGQLAVFIALLVLPVAGYCGEEKAVRLAPGWQSVGIAKLAGYSAPRILNSDGSVWMGRGANLHDTRSCDACAYEPLSASNIAEVERRADKLIDIWGANYIHLSMDSYSAQFANKDLNSPRRQYKNVVGDPDYLRAIEQIVKHITDKGAYVLLYLHSDPCLGANPAAARGDEVRGEGERRGVRRPAQQRNQRNHQAPAACAKKLP